MGINKYLESIIGKVSDTKTMETIERIHSVILSSDKKIMFRVFPIYIRYSKNDKVIALLYFYGKFVNPTELVLGLNLSKKPKLSGFKKADYMKDSNLTYSFYIKDSTISNNDIKKVIGLIE